LYIVLCEINCWISFQKFFDFICSGFQDNTTIIIIQFVRVFIFWQKMRCLNAL
jgi:hypothetical protein